MKKRHSLNPNLRLHYEDHWNGLPVQSDKAPLIVNYLESSLDTMTNAVGEFARTSVMFFELRFPYGYPQPNSEVISRFIGSLKAKLAADSLRKGRGVGWALPTRVYPCRLRFIWAKEIAGSEYPHYHVCIFLNRDAYHTLGKIKSFQMEDGADVPTDPFAEPVTNMANRIMGAWASALQLSFAYVPGLVHFLRNGVYEIDRNSEAFQYQFESVFYRVSYFTKVSTKHYGNNLNSFGCSRG